MVRACNDEKLSLHQTHLKMSLLLSGPRLIHWDCHALCLGPRLGLIDDVDVVDAEDEFSDADWLPPLAISLMRSKGFRSSPLSFGPPPKPPKLPGLPSPGAPGRPPLLEYEGIDVVDVLNIDELYAVLNVLSNESDAELVSPAKPASPNLDNASGERFEPAKSGCKNGIVPALIASAQGKPAID
jgi:hypothetical protein